MMEEDSDGYWVGWKFWYCCLPARPLRLPSRSMVHETRRCLDSEDLPHKCLTACTRRALCRTTPYTSLKLLYLAVELLLLLF